jgi:hypothetical protein
MFGFFGAAFSLLWSLAEGGVGSGVPSNTYVAEDGVTPYVAEDGVTYYVTES